MKSISTLEDLDFRKNPYKGKLIAIEGIDGAGKTTTAKEVVKLLNNAGYNASYSKEPTDDVIGQFIREKVLSGNLKMNPLAIQYLFNADRVMHMDKIEKLLEKGVTIVMDRYFWSSVAYAMSDIEKPQNWYYTAFSILSFYHQFLLPDKTFFLTISEEEALKRIHEMDKQKEIYENASHISRIKENYEKIMHEFPDLFTNIDASKSREEVCNDIFQQIKPLL